MGYIARPTYRQIEIGLDINGSESLSISSVAGDAGPFNGTFPAFSGKVILAYMDIVIGKIVNGAAGANAIANTQYLRIKSDTGAYTNAFKFAAGQFTLSNADWSTVGRLYGNINIASTIEEIGSGGNYTWQWHDAKVLSSSMYFKGAFQPVIRMVFQ